MKLTLHLIALLAAMALVFFATGCAPFAPATAPAQRAASAFAAEDSDYTTIGADLKSAAALANPEVRKILADAQARLDDAQRQNAEEKTQVAAIVKHDGEMTARVNDFEDSWLGGKGNRLKWAIFIGASLLLVIGIACLASGTLLTSGAAAPAFVGILMTVGHICTSFFWFIGHGISVLFSEIFRRRTLSAQAANANAPSVNVASIGGQSVQPLQPVMVSGLSTAANTGPFPFGSSFIPKA